MIHGLLVGKNATNCPRQITIPYRTYSLEVPCASLLDCIPKPNGASQHLHLPRLTRQVIAVDIVKIKKILKQQYNELR